MTTSILSLAGTYVLLLFLLVLVLLKSELKTRYKFLLVVLAGACYPWHYGALKAMLGWPVDAAMPGHFEMLGAVTREPDPHSGEPGYIYLWLRNLESEDGVPRAYRLPYFKSLHEKVENTLKQQRQGTRFIGHPLTAGAGQPPDIAFDNAHRDTLSHKPSREP